MHAELRLSLATLLAFVLVLARMAGVFVFVPLPVKDAGPSVARIVFAVASTVALFPRWPAVDVAGASMPAQMTAWMISEAALGLTIGLMAGFLAEALTLGAQILSLQAGYAYASVVDPTTQADSDVLQVFAQLTAGLLFFTLGLHRFVIRVFAASLDSYPPGRFVLNRNLVESVTQLGSHVFTIGLRLAFPIVGLLLMTEIALALLGRISAQLHLGMHGPAIKMMLALLTLVSVLGIAPQLYRNYAAEVFSLIERIVVR